MEIYDSELDFIDKYKPTRRDFLGGILGFFTSTSIPFIAKEPYEKIISQPLTAVKDFKTFVLLDNGCTIQGPGVKEIIDGRLKLFDINITQSLLAKGSILFYKHKLLSNVNFVAPQPCLNGDILRITHETYFNTGNKIIRPGHPDWDDCVKKKFG